MYVDGNPINYTDPTGLIKQNEARDADRIVQELQTYLVNIEVDWGYRPIPNFNSLPLTVQAYISNGCYWENGLWSLIELNIVKFAVERQSMELKGMFTSFMGTTVVAKVPDTCGRGCTTGNRIELEDNGKLPPIGYPIEKRILDKNVNFDAWSIVHEFGHVWNYRSNGQLGRGLEDYTGGYTDRSRHPYRCDSDKKLPGCNNAGYFYHGIPAFGASGAFNRSEDFSNSFAAFIFPNETQVRIQQLYGNPNNPYFKYLYYPDYRQTPRWDYINKLINGYSGQGR
jgi:hypothetical protein